MNVVGMFGGWRNGNVRVGRWLLGCLRLVMEKHGGCVWEDIVFGSFLGIGLTYMLVWRRIYVAKSLRGEEGSS